jgi:hypothetical protein
LAAVAGVLRRIADCPLPWLGRRLHQ